MLLWWALHHEKNFLHGVKLTIITLHSVTSVKQFFIATSWMLHEVAIKNCNFMNASWSCNKKLFHTSFKQQIPILKICLSQAGFEPVLTELKRFIVQCLNHSAILTNTFNILLNTHLLDMSQVRHELYWLIHS